KQGFPFTSTRRWQGVCESPGQELLSTPFHKYNHVCGEGFLAQTRRERRAYPSGVCKEQATTSGTKRTAARRVASLFGSGFGDHDMTLSIASLTSIQSADVGIRAPLSDYSGGRRKQLQQRPDFQWFRLAFGGQFEGRAGHHGWRDLNERGFRQQHLSRLRLAADAFGSVHGVAHKAVRLDLRAPHQSFDHRPEVETNADAEAHFAEQPPQ